MLYITRLAITNSINSYTEIIWNFSYNSKYDQEKWIKKQENDNDERNKNRKNYHSCNFTKYTEKSILKLKMEELKGLTLMELLKIIDYQL